MQLKLHFNTIRSFSGCYFLTDCHRAWSRSRTKRRGHFNFSFNSSRKITGYKFRLSRSRHGLI